MRDIPVNLLTSKRERKVGHSSLHEQPRVSAGLHTHPISLRTASRKFHLMVSFSCEVCNDTVIKKKLDQHTQRCRGAYFTCIDCSTTFDGTAYRNHTLCISEAEKYEKGLYKGKKNKPVDSKPVQKPAAKSEKAAVEAVKPVPVKATKASKASDSLDLTKVKSGSLYKIVKNLASDGKTDKKAVLKKLQVKMEDGKLVLTL